MSPAEFKKIRSAALRLTQKQLAAKLGTTRMTVTRYENGVRRIPGVVEFALYQLKKVSRIPLAGTVAAGNPIEQVPQSEFVDVPAGMAEEGDHFALQIAGESMRDEGILPGDLVIIRRQYTARNGQTVIALVNSEATIKNYHYKGNYIELQPANPTMKPFRVTPKDDFKIQGVVVGVIRYLGKRRI
jgi:repressor LexA